MKILICIAVCFLVAFYFIRCTNLPDKKLLFTGNCGDAELKVFITKGPVLYEGSTGFLLSFKGIADLAYPPNGSYTLYDGMPVTRGIIPDKNIVYFHPEKLNDSVEFYQNNILYLEPSIYTHEQFLKISNCLRSHKDAVLKALEDDNKNDQPNTLHNLPGNFRMEAVAYGSPKTYSSTYISSDKNFRLDIYPNGYAEYFEKKGKSDYEAGTDFNIQIPFGHPDRLLVLNVFGKPLSTDLHLLKNQETGKTLGDVYAITESDHKPEQ